MTIKLLADWPPYLANHLLTLDANTEAGLVAAKLATTTLTGGVVPPTATPSLPAGISRPTESALAQLSSAQVAGVQALVSGAWNPTNRLPSPRATPGTTVVDFGQGAASVTSSAVQSSGTLTWNPTGWHDGTGCMEFAPSSDSFSEIRLYWDAAKQFDLNSEDGFAVEWSMPNCEDKSNPSIAVTVGKGATSTSTPANTSSIRLVNYPAGVPYFSGRRYDRTRWDTTTADAKAGPWPGIGFNTTGTGVARADTINWARFEFSRCGGKTVKFKRIVRGGRARPVIVMGTDAAAFYPLNELVSAYFAQAGWAWSINQYSGGGNGYEDLVKSQQVIAAVVAAGSDFNINDLQDRNLASAGLTYAQALAVAQQTMDKARARGWTRGSNIHVWNNNAFNDTVVSAFQAAGVVAARAGGNEGRYVYTEGGVVNPMRIPAASWDQMTAAAMTAQVDRCIETGCSFWTYWHNVYSTACVTDDGQTAVGSATPSAYAASNATYCTPRGIDGLTVWWEELKGALDYIKTKQAAGQIDVMSPSQWCVAHGLPALLS